MKTPINSPRYTNPSHLWVVPFIALIIFGFATSNSFGQTIDWYPNLNSARQAAKAQNKLVLMHFGADWCRPCHQLDTFVFSDGAVQRAFADNVIAVKIDADKEHQLVEQYGVRTIPYDVAITPEGRLVSKRRSPAVATGYEKMVSGFSKAINALEQGGPALTQSIPDLQSAINGLNQRANRQQQSSIGSNSEVGPSDEQLRLIRSALKTNDDKPEAKAASFTPGFPVPQQHQPSVESSELKRKSQKISNPFVQQNNQNVANGSQPSRQMTAPAQMPKPLALPKQQKLINQHALTVPSQIVPPPEMKMVDPLEWSPTVDENSFQVKAPQDQNQFKAPELAQPEVTQNQFATQFPPVQVPSNQFQPNAVSANDTTISVAEPNSVPGTLELNPQAANQFGSGSQTQPSAPVVSPRNLALQRLDQSDVAARLVREQAERKMLEYKAEPKLVMEDRYFGDHTARQIADARDGNYKATITVPGAPGTRGSEFLPPEPPKFGNAAAQLVMDGSQPGTAARFKEVTPDTAPKAIQASSAMGRPSQGNRIGLIDRGLGEAAKTTTKPKYALHGKCPVTLLSQSKWVDGDENIGCVHRNRIYLFTSQENLELFQSDPDAYSPILAGYDPVIYQETRRLVSGLERHGVFMGQQPRQRIVLFASAETRARFQKNPRKYLESVRTAMQQSGGSSSALIR